MVKLAENKSEAEHPSRVFNIFWWQIKSQGQTTVSRKSALVGRRLATLQALCDRCWILAAVEYRDDGGDFVVQVVIDRERKSLGERAMQVSNRLGMDTGKQRQRIDVSKETVEEYSPMPACCSS